MNQVSLHRFSACVENPTNTIHFKVFLTTHSFNTLGYEIHFVNYVMDDFFIKCASFFDNRFSSPENTVSLVVLLVLTASCFYVVSVLSKTVDRFLKNEIS